MMTTVGAVKKSDAKENAALARRLREQSRARWVPGVGLLGLAFGLLILGAILMAANQSRLRDNLHWLDHTQQGLRQAANLDIAPVDVGAGGPAQGPTNRPT